MFQYSSEQEQTTMVNGRQRTKRNIVTIKGNKGSKTVVLMENGKTRKSTKRLSPQEISKIQRNQFIPGLFKPCENCLRPLRSPSRSTRRSQKKRSGHRYD